MICDVLASEQRSRTCVPLRARRGSHAPNHAVPTTSNPNISVAVLPRLRAEVKAALQANQPLASLQLRSQPGPPK